MKKHFFPILLLLICGLFSFGYTGILNLNFRLEEFWTRPLTSSNKDSAILSPLVLKLTDHALYPHDVAVDEFYKFYPKPFLLGLSGLSKLFGSLDTAYIVGSILINLLFWLSLYALFFKVTNERWVSMVMVLAATFYPRSAFGTAYWGLIVPSEVIPRNLFLALTPLFLLGFLKYFHSSKLPLVFLALGVLVNLHSLSAIHFAILLGLVLVWDSLRRKEFFRLILSGLAFVVGACPEILAMIRYGGGDAVPEEILRFRLPNFYLPTWYEIRTIGLVIILPVICGLGGFIIRSKGGLTAIEKQLVRFLVAIIVVSAGGLVLMWQEKFLSFQFLRVTVYLYLWGFIFACFLVSWLWKRGIIGKILSLLVILILAFPKYEAAPRYIFGAYESILARFEGRKIAIEFSIKEVVDLEKMSSLKGKVWAVNFSNDWASFDKLCAWAKTNTKTTAMFLVPPDGFSLFRVYAERGLVVNIKDGSQSGFSADYARNWFNRYNEVKKAFELGSESELTQVAKKYGASYIILADHRLMSLTIAYKNDAFVVYYLN